MTHSMIRVPDVIEVGSGAVTPGRTASMAWLRAGEQRLARTLDAMDPAAVHADSALPGWTRGHLLTHLARNADALVNLLNWARTGEPTPMYASPGQRDADIERGAPRPLDEQRADLRAAGARFHDTVAALTGEHWPATVRSAQGTELGAASVPWLRAREVWIHLADLNLDAGPDAWPEDFAVALLHDVAGWMSGTLPDATELRPGTGEPVRLGDGAVAREVSGSAPEIAAWLVGRADGGRLRCTGPLPDLPPWL